ncbi:MAG: hypothetical protein ACOY31_01915 [Bacillota bacterium]
MSGEDGKFTGMEETLFQLLRSGASGGVGPDDLIILLGLVNLMGLIDIINYRAGIKKEGVFPPPEGAGNSVDRPGGPAARGGAAFDPGPLISMLAGKDGAGSGHGHLAGLLGRLMGPPPGRPGETAPGTGQSETLPAGNDSAPKGETEK